MGLADRLVNSYLESRKAFAVDGKGFLVRQKKADPYTDSEFGGFNPFKFDQKLYKSDDKMPIAGIANENVADRMNEVLLPNGLLQNAYNKNPILLLQHSHACPIGQVPMLKPQSDGVHFEAWVGDPKAAPLTSWQNDTRSLVAQDILKAVSVGFIPMKIRMPAYNDEGAMVDPAKIEEWEMLELSIVAVPCNAGSLFGMRGIETGLSVQSLAFDAKLFTKVEARAWADRNGFKSASIVEQGGTFEVEQDTAQTFDGLKVRTLANGVTAMVGTLKGDPLAGIFKGWNFPTLGADGRFVITTKENTMDPKELKELLAGIKSSNEAVATSLNALVEGQKTLTQAFEKGGKKPDPKDPAEPDEDDKKAMKGLHLRLEAIDSAMEAQGKTIAMIAEKALGVKLDTTAA